MYRFSWSSYGNSGCFNNIESKKQKIEQDTDLKYDKLSKVSANEANFKAIEKTVTTLKSELSDIISEIDSGRIKSQEIEKEFLKMENTKKQKEKEINLVNEQKEKVFENIKK